MATTKLNQKSEKLLKEEKAKLAETDTTSDVIKNVDETLQADLNQPKEEAEEESKVDDSSEADSKQEETKINLLMRDDLLIALGEQNKYAHLECGKYLVGDITDEKLEKFYKEFGYYVTSEADYVIWHSLKKLFESV